MRPGASGVLLVVVTSACSGSPSVQAERATSALVGGAVDETTTGVVAIAVDAPPVFATNCTGALVAPNLVITARHCVAATDGTPDDQVTCDVARFADVAPAKYFVVSPSTTLPASRTSPALFRALDVRVAEATDGICGADVALLVLEGEGIPKALATPLVPRIDGPASVRESFTAIGYGFTDAMRTADGTRMRLDGRTVRCLGGQCATMTDLLREGEWLSVDAPLCPGDSGSPALDADGRVFGVASRAGNGCSSAVYSDVAAFRDLIVAAGRDAARAAGTAAPAWTSGISALGVQCTGACPDGLACYAETGEPPGECVPHCTSDTTCPEGYRCVRETSVCARATPGSRKGSCHVARVTHRGDTGATLLVLATLSLLAGFRAKK